MSTKVVKLHIIDIETMAGRKFSNNINTLLPLNDSVCRIYEISNEIENTVTQRIEDWCALRLDESTDVPEIQVLLVIVRYIYVCTYIQQLCRRTFETLYHQQGNFLLGRLLSL